MSFLQVFTDGSSVLIVITTLMVGTGMGGAFIYWRRKTYFIGPKEDKE